ncbi:MULTISPECIES: CcoQ/FixQ family Cbb3-type cytochrome c oxidase assembly chaperone [Croceimicrobium]|uniref:CcoQ/FixQ family Cbb3-type cytochrome c oxidase assembly chaperone n=1 Tax=Croceimicrobium hydrocarbonivorans TaxID=2761580 RepID=A0A7H0VIK7_9FLAO|nr:CcoQ/FixQ family Cbb3-type cytochrome c oxidase assembly chaperone [Croceimicrobium hydrocarbonivorans]QNR25555.1 CcoQ/FixQ family Cbb3-type cytochrome c oxidase assembly chaperone [Croceimicrobium hydrocarbonivorans]
MLKFIKHNMETIDGVSIYPILSFLIFFSIFILAIIYVIRKDRKSIEEISLLPLNDNANPHEKTK